MNIQDIRAKKEELKREIEGLISKYEADTDTAVKEISIRRTEWRVEGGRQVRGGVEIDVDVEI